MTHYVPYFAVEEDDRRFLSSAAGDRARRRPRRLQAACGAVVTYPTDHTTEPTCPACAAWLVQDAADLAALVR